VSYKRAGEMIAELDLEVAELMKKAEDADSAPLEEGLTIPDEIARRNERKAVLKAAKAEMEKMYKEAQEEEVLAKAEEKKKEAEKKQAQSVTAEAEPVKSVETVVKPVETEKPAETAANKPEKVAGISKKDSVKPLDKYQYNFTDPESKIKNTHRRADGYFLFYRKFIVRRRPQ
jgi:hypothetical protein